MTTHREVTENLINGINEYVRKTIAKERVLTRARWISCKVKERCRHSTMELGIIDETAYLQDYVLESSGALGATEQHLEDQNSEDAEKTMINFKKMQRSNLRLEKFFRMNSNTLSSSRKVPKYPPGSGMMTGKHVLFGM